MSFYYRYQVAEMTWSKPWSIIRTIRGSPFLNNSITFAILQGFGSCRVVKERFTKYKIGKDKTSQFFSIGVGKLLRPDDLLLEKIFKYFNNFIKSGWRSRYVIGDFFPLGISFAMLGPIFLKKKLEISAIFAGLKSKVPLYFKVSGVDLLFLPTLTIEQIASQVFDRSVWTLDRHQQGPTRSVLLVIIGWLVTHFSQKWL